MKKLITVFGPSSVKREDTLYADAERIGKLLAQSGFNIVTGGYEGVMEAASKGARQAEGGVVGVTAEVYFARGRKPNSYLTRELQVKSAVDRLMELIDLSDASIAIGISPGTMVEIITVWDYIMKGFIEPRPLILVGKEWNALGQFFDAHDYLTHHRGTLSYARTPEEAIEFLEKRFGKQERLPELNVISD